MLSPVRPRVDPLRPASRAFWAWAQHPAHRDRAADQLHASMSPRARRL